MRVMITGSEGMVGRNLVEKLESQDYDLLLPSLHDLNLLILEDVKTYISKHNPDLVIHCAGQVGGIQANMSDMYGFFINNLLMGVNLVKASKDYGVPRLLNLASSCAYPRNRGVLRESDILTGELEPTNEGYALSKISVLKMCNYISEQFEGLDYKTIIPCNLYGKWDKFAPENAHMIPSVIRKIHFAKIEESSEVLIWGSGKVRREFMYAGDIADFISLAIDKFDSLPSIINVGLGHDYTIQQYYEIIANIVGYKGNFVNDLTKPEGMTQKLLNTELQRGFGWSPKTSLEEGVRLTYEFFIDNVLKKV